MKRGSINVSIVLAWIREVQVRIRNEQDGVMEKRVAIVDEECHRATFLDDPRLCAHDEPDFGLGVLRRQGELENTKRCRIRLDDKTRTR